MPQTTYGFKDKQVALNARDGASQQPPRSTAEPAFMTQNFTFLVQTPSEGIPAINGTTPGKALCVALDIIPAGITDTINHAGDGNPLEVEVSNVTKQAIDGNIVITATVIGNIPCVGMPSGIPPIPYIRFLTTAKMVEREVAATIELTSNVEFGSPGDPVVITDPNTMWGECEAAATGWAYWRVANARWEIESCSLPIREITGVIDTCLKHADLDAVIKFGSASAVPVPDWSLSAYPNVDMPPEVNEASTDDFSITALNTCHFDAPEGTSITIRRNTTSTQSDPSNTTVPKAPGTSTAENWEIVSVCEQLARWTLWEWAGTPILETWWEGGDPRACDAPLVCRIACACLKDGDKVMAHYDPEAHEYVATTTASALLGTPTEIPIVQSIGFDSGLCGLTYEKTTVTAFACDPTPTSETVPFPTTTIFSVDAFAANGSQICLTRTGFTVIACGGGGSEVICIDICPILCLCEEIYSLPDVCPPPPECNCCECYFVSGPTALQVEWDGDSHGSTMITADSGGDPCKWQAEFDDDGGGTVLWNIDYTCDGIWLASGPWPGATNNGTIMSYVSTDGDCSGTSSLEDTGNTPSSGSISADGSDECDDCEDKFCDECGGDLVAIYQMVGSKAMTYDWVQKDSPEGDSVITGNCMWAVPITITTYHPDPPHDIISVYDGVADVQLLADNLWVVAINSITIDAPPAPPAVFDPSWSGTKECLQGDQEVSCIDLPGDCKDNDIASMHFQRYECGGTPPTGP